MGRARTTRQGLALAYGTFRYREAQSVARMTLDERRAHDEAQAKRADQMRRNVQVCHACGQETPEVIGGHFSFDCQNCGADLAPF